MSLLLELLRWWLLATGAGTVLLALVLVGQLTCARLGRRGARRRGPRRPGQAARVQQPVSR